MSVDRRQVARFIKEVLKSGTPDWYRFPRDYKAMVDEWHREAQENLWAECRAYKDGEQETLSNIAGRRVNIMSAAEFMRRLRAAGLTCFSHDSELKDGTASLFVLMPTINGGEFEPMASIQVPLMWEWTTMRIDPVTNLPCGWRDIGWRSAVLSLIKSGALTEEQADRIFGKPRVASVSRIHRRLLFHYRNGGNRNATKAA